jgi:hypothetical protein
MDREGFFDRLDFHDDQAAYDHVHAETGVHADVPVPYGSCDLSKDRNITCAQLVSEAFFVDGLQKARAWRGVNREGRIDDLTGESIMFGAWLRNLGNLAAWRFNCTI